MKKIVAFLLAGTMAFAMTACGSGESSSEGASQISSGPAGESKPGSRPANGFRICMVTDAGGVNDQSFNQSAWEGLQKLEEELGAKVSYIESKQEADYATNLDKAADDNADLIWGVGFAMADAVTVAAIANPDIQYAIVDNAYDEATMPENVTGVMFRAQEPSFIVGYIAGKTTSTNRVGFVGGVTSDIVDQFQYGYQAGVAYAAMELNKTVTVDVQYAESFTDASKGKAIASKMFSDGCDIVFHAAGGVGVGVIEAAKDANKLAIGVDRDQAYLAPKNVLTSAVKLVNVAVESVSKEMINGEKTSGKTYTYGLKEGAVGIPEDDTLMGEKTYQDALKVEELIKSGEVIPPANAEEYTQFIG